MRLVGKSALFCIPISGAILGAPGAHAIEWGAGLDAGYAFRSASDGNNHGATASAFVDVPLPGPFAVRPEVLSLQWNKLAFLGGSTSLVYSFDDSSSVQALAALGPLAGVSVVGKDVAFRAGILASLGLRIPVLEAVSIEARVSVPFIAYGPEGANGPAQEAYANGAPVPFPFVATFAGGVVFDLGALFSELH